MRSGRFRLVQRAARTLRAALLAIAAHAGRLARPKIAVHPKGPKLATLLVGLAFAALAPAASAQITFAPCGNTNDFACGHLTVPLDPSGTGTEVITLAMRRHLAPVGGASEAVIALAGGPGQAAIPFSREFAALLGPILSTRDLIVFDQRGIGLSHPLSCSAFEHLGNRDPSPQAVALCAGQIGASHGFYETADTVSDIEAIRQAGDYEKLVLYGTSYGTKVAERYAQRYPTHVAALVLDSVVLPNGPDPLRRSTFAAIPRILRGLCAEHACAHITGDPVRDLGRLVQIMQRHPVAGREIDGHGHAHTVRASSEDLLEVLFAGDFNPFLRAEFPAAVRSAAEGDTAELARMLGRAEGEGEPSERESLAEGFDAPLYFATTCEEQDFPFNRAASPSTRRAEAIAQVRALPADSFAPFTFADALAVSDLGVCADWPFSTGAPELVQAPMPTVPTLIFSGEDDIRTPTSDAQALAAQIPGAQLVVVAHTGHSTLGSALGGCPRKALQAFFAGRAIKPCNGNRSLPPLAPMPLAPRRLAQIAPARGTHGPGGRTLHAVLLTLADFSRQSALELISELTGGKLFLKLLEVRVGGLRAGWGELSEGTVNLHRYTYVPGVAVSGKLVSGHGTLRIAGSARVRGTLRATKTGTLSGVLGGQRVSSRQRIPLL
jgi:pimeloyl-ACP methyl ester carboxylesterase